MPSTSSIVNRSLRAIVNPALRESAFTKVDARNGWRSLGKVVWVFNIRAVGDRFSRVTGWPPGSVGVSLGVFYPFIPVERPVKRDRDGRLLPEVPLCQMRSKLECSLDQSDRAGRLSFPQERRRKDLWWIGPDGTEASLAATNIVAALRDHGLPWFARYSDLARTFADVEGWRDGFTKFDTAAFLARQLGHEDRWATYVQRAKAERERIDRLTGRPRSVADRYGI
jgi:hypothetical protein